MINGADVIGTMLVFAMGFAMGALFFFTMRAIFEDDEESEEEE